MAKKSLEDIYGDAEWHPLRTLGAALGAFVMIPTVALMGYEYLRADVNSASLREAIAADGLKTEKLEIAYDGRTATLVLDLGSCSVKNVQARLELQAENVTDARGYEFKGYSLAQAYRDRRKVSGGDKNGSVEVTNQDIEGTPKEFHFQNLGDLQAKLGADPCYTLGVTRFLQTDER